MERESPFSVSLEVKMAAKLVNLGFGFGPPRNPRSGPPWVSRAERRERKREQGRGGEGRREKGGEVAVELLTSIHHCVTKNELERERGKGGGCLVHTGCPFLPMLLREIERRLEPR